MNRTHLFTSIILIGLLTLTLTLTLGLAPIDESDDEEVGRVAGSGYDLSWYTIDGGGGTSSGGGFELSGTIGQPDAGTMSGGNFVLAGGFWAGTSEPPQEPVTCPGDLSSAASAGSPDNVVDIFDLLFVLANWGPCASCAPGECAADVSSAGGAGSPDCVVDIFDLLFILANWGPCP